MKKLWAFLIGLVGVLVYFLTKYDIQEEMRTKKDKQLDKEIGDNITKILDETKKIEALEKPEAKELSPNEAVSYWNSKK